MLRAVMENRYRSDAERQRFAEISRVFGPAGGRIVRQFTLRLIPMAAEAIDMSKLIGRQKGARRGRRQ